MWFIARYLLERLRLAIATVLRLDRTITVGARPMLVPSTHRLPMYQALTPTYDHYAAWELAALCADADSPLLIDVGANIGDTALLAVDAVPNIRVLSVEGDPKFLRYLRKNVQSISDQVDVIDSFVMPSTTINSGLHYRSDGSTGGFAHQTYADCENGAKAGRSLSTGALLSRTAGFDLVVWKSDTDGLDISLLLADWDAVNVRCGVIWFEFDPNLDVEKGRRIEELTQRLAASNRLCRVFDNYGRWMCDIPAAAVESVLGGLASWLRAPGIPGRTAYFDVWAIDEWLVARAASQPRTSPD